MCHTCHLAAPYLAALVDSYHVAAAASSKQLRVGSAGSGRRVNSMDWLKRSPKTRLRRVASDVRCAFVRWREPQVSNVTEKWMFHGCKRIDQLPEFKETTNLVQETGR